ncbi:MULTISPECIES: DUF742 domain-containing protein [Saccharopolyspora]|uniref:DUF742 domain-containing protein n=1 Tax=Saccharopolyspora cebuensis TaxID=418759 RepID=A0ABV4CP63_9PSEU
MPWVSGEFWVDEAAGPLVRPYAWTRGRTRPGRPELHLVTQLVAARRECERVGLSAEHWEIMELCRQPLSVAEVAAYLDIPLVVVKVLVSDLLERGIVVAGAVPQVTGMFDRKLLQAVLDGVRKL